MEKIDEILEGYRAQEEERLRRNLGHAAAGARFADIRSAYVGEEVVIGAGALIGPCVTLEGATVIGEDCVIGQNSRISGSKIGRGARVEQSVIIDSQVGQEASIGPFAYLRPGSDIGDRARVGDFVEVKNSRLGQGSKASHLTYIGDSEVGDGVNLGCGVVFVNYDGRNKHRSTVGDGAFVGCNANIISPVNVGAGAYVAAGTTVTEDVPEGALALGRERQKNIDGWASRVGLLNRKK